MRSFALLMGVAAALLVILVVTKMGPSTDTVGAAGPVLTVSPSSGPPGQVVTVAGSGFVKGDEVFVEVFPGTRRDGGTLLIGKVTAINGEFRFNVRVWNVYPGLGAPDPAPPGGGQPLANVVQGPWTLLAYPLSAGPRTQETVGAAPKAVFTVVAGLPEGGGRPQQGNTEGSVAMILCGGALALAGIGLAGGSAVWRGRSRKGCGRSAQWRSKVPMDARERKDTTTLTSTRVGSPPASRMTLMRIRAPSPVHNGTGTSVCSFWYDWDGAEWYPNLHTHTQCYVQ